MIVLPDVADIDRMSWRQRADARSRVAKTMAAHREDRAACAAHWDSLYTSDRAAWGASIRIEAARILDLLGPDLMADVHRVAVMA